MTDHMLIKPPSHPPTQDDKITTVTVLDADHTSSMTPGVGTSPSRTSPVDRLKQSAAQLVHLVSGTLQVHKLGSAGYEALVEQVRNENEYLRNQLARLFQQIASEREHGDVLHHQALARIDALSASVDKLSSGVETLQRSIADTNEGDRQLRGTSQDDAIIELQFSDPSPHRWERLRHWTRGDQ